MKEAHTSRSQRRWPFSRRKMLTHTALSATGFLTSSLLTACSNESTAVNSYQGKFPPHPIWNFVFINHVKSNPFFVTTQYGIQDACALLGCKYKWAGSAENNISEMLDVLNTAISTKVDGIAISIIDPIAFNEPMQQAIDKGIPIISYNADVPAGITNARLAYIGQDLFLSGQQMGKRIVDLVPQGDIAGFFSTYGSLNIQPRIDGAAKAIQDSGLSIKFMQIETSPKINEEVTRIEAYYLNHQNIKGMFAFDAGSTQGVAQIMKKYALAQKGVHAGGYDLLAQTLQGIKEGYMDFTIDQQPYLQGFLTVVQLFLYKLSGGLSQPSDTNTGHLFVTKATVDPYLNIQTRFEGSTDKEKFIPRS